MELKAKAGRFFATLLFGLLCITAYSQSRVITGKVIDDTGEPIIGASVAVVGTTNGTITNFDGEFTLSSVTAGEKLQISFIGYISQTISIGNQSRIDVKLLEDSKTLDEVVVIGYGVVKKRDLTGSVASVNNEVLTSNPVADVSQALQGRLPGVSVMSQDGRPGADVAIRVRGGGSITQSNDPLFIVDGFPVSSISNIPADQIESIDVLKDASSTAIYGARGANGVILVTTKGGKAGKITVSYNAYVQVKEAAKKLSTLNAQEYVLHTWSYADAMGASYRDGIETYFGLGATNGNHYDDYASVKRHDWTNDMLRTAIGHNHNLSIVGGSEKTKIAFSLNYLNDEGIKINSNFKRVNASLKVQQELYKNLNLDLDIRYDESELKGKETSTNGKGSLLSGAYRWRPIDNPLGDATAIGGFGIGADNIDLNYGSPVDFTNDVQNITERNTFRGIAALTWDIVKGLKARSEIGLQKGWSETKYYEDGLTRSYKYAKLTKGNNWSVRSATTLNYEVQGLGDSHSLSVLLGNEVLASKSNSSYIIGAGYPDSFDMNQTFGMIDQTDKSLALDEFGNTIGTPARTVSFFGRVNYSYLGRYLLTATFRTDGSSKFAPNNRWGYFPAGAFAWRISDEPFMENTNNWLDNLKLRLSLGLSGADNIDSSLWRETWTSSTVTYNGISYSGFKPNGMLSNPDLKWETTISRNIGVDFGVWNNRLSGSVDLYWNTTKDLLMCVPIDETTGYAYQYQNIGRTSNKGVEILLNWDVYRNKNFSLNISATYNYNRNNIDKLSDNIIAQYGSQWASSATNPTYDYIFQKGSPVGVIRGFKSAGFYTTDDFDYDPSTNMYSLKKNGVADISSTITGNYPSHFNIPEGQNAFPGALKLVNTNDDEIVDLNDVVEIGNVTPRNTGGFNINATWKNFDFSTAFTWAAGGKVYNVNALINTYGNKETGLGTNKLALMNKSYKIYDVQGGELVAVSDPTKLDEMNRNAKYAVPYMENGVTYDTFIEDASYLRLNTLTIGYTIPKLLTQRIGMQRARVYATAGNLFTITGYSGIDPEVNADPYKSTTSANKGNYPMLGLDYGTYPRARTFTFGVNIEF